MAFPLKRVNTLDILNSIDQVLPSKAASPTPRTSSLLTQFTFQVTILSGRELKVVRETFPGDLQDPFVVATFDQEQYTTEDAIEGHQHPVFSNAIQEFCAEQQALMTKCLPILEFEVFDRDIMSDIITPIGLAAVDLNEFFQRQKQPQVTEEISIDLYSQQEHTGQVLIELKAILPPEYLPQQVYQETKTSIENEEHKAEPSSSNKELEVELLAVAKVDACTDADEKEEPETAKESEDKKECPNEQESGRSQRKDRNRSGFQVSWTSTEALDKQLAMRKAAAEEAAAITIQKRIRGQLGREQAKLRLLEREKIKTEQEKKVAMQERVLLRSKARNLQQQEMLKHNRSMQYSRHRQSTEAPKDKELQHLKQLELEKLAKLKLQTQLDQLSKHREQQKQLLVSKQPQKKTQRQQEQKKPQQHQRQIDQQLKQAIRLTYNF